jgi:hypothetical protein
MADDIVFRVSASHVERLTGDPEVLSAAFKIAQRASPADGEVEDGGPTYAVQAGQFLTTQSTCAFLFRCSRDKARAILARGVRLGVFQVETVWPIAADPEHADKRTQRTLITVGAIRVFEEQAPRQRPEEPHTYIDNPDKGFSRD